MPGDTDHHEARINISSKMPGEISSGSEREDPADVSTSSIGSAIVEGLASLGQRIMGSIGYVGLFFRLVTAQVADELLILHGVRGIICSYVTSTH